MNIQMMEGLVGASTNIKMSNMPMSVYRQASAEGDTEKMKRALGYASECTEKAADYQEKLDKGMEAEAKEEREKAKLEQESAVEDRGQAEKTARPGHFQESDCIQISEEAKAAAKSQPAAMEPVIYGENGEAAAPAPEPAVSFSA